MRYAIITLGIVFLIGCSVFLTDVQKDPFYESFFQKTRLIMSKEEIEIYKHLPDKEAKQDFIRDFWEKRDPSPSTEINENRIEFQERIKYANKWFEEGGGSEGNRQGWNTVRGRIYLQLGPPTLRKMGEQEYTDRFGHLRTTRRDPIEIWEYYQYNLTLAFIANQYGEYRLWGRPPASLGRALREAKNYFHYSTEEALLHKFEFNVDYKNSEIVVTLPTRKLSFEEEGSQVSAEFQVNLQIYVDYEKEEQISRNIRVRDDKRSVLDKKTLTFSIPYTPGKKGAYYFEVIITEKNSGSIYRNFTKFRN